MWRDDKGSTTITAAMMIAGILALTMACISAAATLVDHRRDAVAADLSAIAAAVALQQGTDACDTGDDIARANNKRLDECNISGEDVIVRIGRASARAGPA